MNRIGCLADSGCSPGSGDGDNIGDLAGHDQSGGGRRGNRDAGLPEVAGDVEEAACEGRCRHLQVDGEGAETARQQIAARQGEERHACQHGARAAGVCRQATGYHEPRQRRVEIVREAEVGGPVRRIQVLNRKAERNGAAGLRVGAEGLTEGQEVDLQVVGRRISTDPEAANNARHRAGRVG